MADMVFLFPIACHPALTNTQEIELSSTFEQKYHVL